MIAAWLVLAVAIGAAPCDDLGRVDQRLDSASTAPDLWPAVRDELQASFAPVPLHSGLDPATGSSQPEEIEFVRARVHAICAARSVKARAYAPPDARRL